MTLNSKVLGVVAVLGILALTDVRAQESQPESAALRRERFTAFLLGQREPARQGMDIHQRGPIEAFQRRRPPGDRPPATPVRPKPRPKR